MLSTLFIKTTYLPPPSYHPTTPSASRPPTSRGRARGFLDALFGGLIEGLLSLVNSL